MASKFPRGLDLNASSQPSKGGLGGFRASQKTAGLELGCRSLFSGFQDERRAEDVVEVHKGVRAAASLVLYWVLRPLVPSMVV